MAKLLISYLYEDKTVCGVRNAFFKNNKFEIVADYKL